MVTSARKVIWFLSCLLFCISPIVLLPMAKFDFFSIFLTSFHPLFCYCPAGGVSLDFLKAIILDTPQMFLLPLTGTSASVRGKGH